MRLTFEILFALVALIGAGICGIGFIPNSGDAYNAFGGMFIIIGAPIVLIGAIGFLIAWLV